MKTFEYKGYKLSGSKCKGLIEAMHPKAAKELLVKDGVLVESLSEAGAKSKYVSADLRSVIYREISALLAAGMPLVTALSTLMKTSEMRDVEGVLGKVRDRVREGSSLAQAFSGTRTDISKFEQATIDVAERASSLEVVLVQLADFIDEHEKIRARIQQAMIYPALVLGLGVCVAVVMLGILLPRTQKLMGGGVVADMPLLTRIMLDLGDGMWPWGVLVVAALVIVGVWVVRYIRADNNLRIRCDQKIYKLPLIGRGYRLLSAIRFARTLAILVRAGVSLVEGVGLAGRATGSSWIEQLADRETESLRHGSTLADAIRKIPPLADQLPGWIEVGEASGSLDSMLDRAATRCQVNFDRYLNKTLVLIEPMLLLFIGGFVLLIVLSVMLPMFSLSNTIVK